MRTGCKDLLDQLVGAGEQRRWRLDAKRPGGLVVEAALIGDQIDRKPELRGSLPRDTIGSPVSRLAMQL
jgi:hypothetical protein